LGFLNVSRIVLIPKGDRAKSIYDYRLFSLMHILSKIFMNVLATRLARKIDELVGIGQMAFIKGRRIQDNFMYIHGLLCRLQRTKKPSILVKLDIAKAFDTIS
jgi:hypothetical protein